MISVTWPAPAKLNLFLHITGRRADGYHELQTVFQFIDRCDELRFTSRDDGVIRPMHALPGLDPGRDLTVRAARLLQSSTGVNLGADICLDKRLPIGGGLGGGSSDAATTLVVLNCLWKLGLSLAELAGLGLQLGADVPVFVRGRSAWAEGVGERLTEMNLDEPWYLVVVPPCQVSTDKIFAAPDLTRDSVPITIDNFLTARMANDCEAAVRRRYPQVAEAFRTLERYAVARLTGTGACVFAAFQEQQEAHFVLRQLASTWPANWQGFVAKGMNESPLHRALYGSQIIGV